MNIHYANFIISAVSPKQYPSTQYPEIALAGRSNVGKSSFINKLINRKNLARTSSKPGKTQTLNFYDIEHLFYFVDVPGYGYAKVSKTERAKWGKMLEDYFTQRHTLKKVFLLMDFRHDPTTEDVQMKEFVEYYNIPYQIIATKIDKIPRSKWNKHESAFRKKLNLSSTQPILLFSAETGEGKDAAWDSIQKAIQDGEISE
ncbi:MULTISPECIES: ribosome biogenesis GTP-binding protein YihA/YsxC [unclassified Granulicatella]|uniref:ribosome biogenesis GTP-binding protein YihA/YsxC n=1 Tax=unclassified Granulicatella TaxID=2630493 RepID=UPI001073BEAA|nr:MULTISPECIES: ribosome biogenesis GTP-binding protein YihA/YsxC [unclassified Granulicatella]MBF0780272.1 YihA family ribosome biogenesis GTP-binding protein [Granulicatella sp. 19428wC4_WM01]TFU95608.1 YihA family ribosome biogenesis GTP-binding protein [Granulicatella sp. WM01]